MKIRTAVNRVLGPFDARVVRASTYLSVDDMRRERGFLHGRPAGPPDLEFELPRFEVEDADLVLARRVVDALRAALEDEASLADDRRPSGDLWERIASESQGDFVRLARAGDVAGVAVVLVNALQHQVSYGLNTDSHRLTFHVASSPAEAPHLATVIADRFVAFAEAVGVLYAENPEWGRWGVNIYADLGKLYGEVERAVGATLDVPPCFGLYGVRAGDSVIHPMTPMNAYAAWRAFEVLSEVTLPAICEIGGGYGGTAYYAFQRPLARYTVIDLPVVNALQGYFLLKTCGSDRVALYGEDGAGRPLHVLPYWTMAELPDKSFDLCLSQESLPEIDRSQARAYVAEIARTTRRWFLSLNQESQGDIGYKDFEQGVVPALVAEHGGFRRRRRYPFWLRPGEVEELYEVS